MFSTSPIKILTIPTSMFVGMLLGAGTGVYMTTSKPYSNFGDLVDGTILGGFGGGAAGGILAAIM